MAQNILWLSDEFVFGITTDLNEIRISVGDVTLQIRRGYNSFGVAEDVLVIGDRRVKTHSNFYSACEEDTNSRVLSPAVF